jgi:hypothetical protein
VALYWHGPADVLAVYGDGFAFLGPPASRHWWEMVSVPQVAGWLREQMIDLGGPGGRASHHLVVDRSRGLVRVVQAADARALVTQRAPRSAGR